MIEKLRKFNWNEFFIGIVFFSISFSNRVSNVAILISLIYFLIMAIKKKTWRNLLLFLPSIVIFIFHCVGYLTSTDLLNANKELLQFLPFIIFPFLFITLINDQKTKKDNILKYFICGLILKIFIALICVSYDIWFLDVRYGYGRGVNLFIKYSKHHVYFSMYIIIGILSIAYLISKKEFSVYFLFLIPILYIIIFYLSSRIAIFISLTIVPIASIYFLSRTFTIKNLFRLGAIFIIMIILTIVSFDYTRDKLMHTYYDIFYPSKEKEEKFFGWTSRIVIWKTSWDLIKRKPLFGYGIGDVESQLNTVYEENGHNHLKNNNSHSDYLTLSLMWGVLLTFSFVVLIIAVIIKLFKANAYFYPLLLLIPLILGLTESLLQRYAGIIYFAYTLNYVLYIINKKDPYKTEKQI